MNARYGVLLVSGFHTHQEIYAKLFAQDPRCRLIAVADEADAPERRHRLNQRFAEQWGLPYLDLETALAREDIHIASVCTELERRGRAAIRCAEAGKHVYLDKPIVGSLADADALVAAVERAGVHSQMFSFNYAPWVRRAKDVLESGALGELLAIHCDILFAKGHAGSADLGQIRRESPVPRRFTFLDSKHELITTGIYSLAIIYGLTRRPIRTVYGMTANYFFREHQRNDVEDFGTLTLELEGGILASLSAGRIGWKSHPHAGPCEIHLIGRQGTCRIDGRRPRLEVFADEPAWEKPDPHPEDPMGFWPSTLQESNVPPKNAWVLTDPEGPNDVSDFLDCLDRDEASPMSVSKAAMLVEALMAGYASAARGEAVSLPLDRGRG